MVMSMEVTSISKVAKGSDVQIGIFGTGYGELSSKILGRMGIKSWSKETGQKVKHYKEHQRKKIETEQRTLDDAINVYLTDAKYEWVNHLLFILTLGN